MPIRIRRPSCLAHGAAAIPARPGLAMPLRRIALAGLVAFCRQHGITLIDCQQATGHLASLGGREVPRADFVAHVAQAVQQADIADWTYDAAWWQHLLPSPSDQRPA